MSLERAPTGPPGAALLAVDTGGTFTDFVLLEPGEEGSRIWTLKVPSTPGDPADAVLEGIRRLLGGEGAAPFHLVHGSTVGTNALLEGRGARVALITNRGFEDVIEIGRQNRPQLYVLVGHRPPAPVDREARLGIGGRLAADGSVVEPLDLEELEGLPERVAATGASAVAVVLLHAYGNPAHEEAVVQALASAGLPVSRSSEVLAEIREYERTATTVVNAALVPLMSGYLHRIEQESGAERVRIMGSSGGALSVARAGREPVHTVVSGPAGGVVGALVAAREAGITDILTFDMGGTSTDVALCPGRPLRTREFTIGGLPVAVPVLDIHTVGAGGGSLARVDPGGALRVGPRSAGAVPGPIAYGRGGKEPTVTDAQVWLGRLPPEGFLGGAGRLDREAVAGPLGTLAEAMGSSREKAAEGILRVADATMERALRVISVERGYDPAAAVLVAFGGAGALHAASLAERLGTDGALIPPDPGLLSARGMLGAAVTVEGARTLLAREDDPEHQAALEEAFQALEERGVEQLVAEGMDPATLTIRRQVDARFRGQSFELTVDAESWALRFREAHRVRYGHAREDHPLEAVTLRVEVSAPAPTLPSLRLAPAAGSPPLTSGQVWLEGAWREVPRVQRSDLREGHTLEGPLVVLEYSATTWLPPGWTLEVLPAGALRLRERRG